MSRKQARFGQPAVYNATPPTLTDGDDSALNVDASGRLIAILASGSTTGITPATTGTPTNVASSASSVTILAANSGRKGATITNDSTQVLYLLYSTGTASATNYSVQLAAGAYWELPFNYTGQLTGIWASANGNARVTELT